MQSFHEVRFPIDISFGATGGPERRTEIVALTSGREKRNLRHAHSRRRFDAGTGVRSMTELYEIVEFFEARRGPFHGFRFRDPFDMKSCSPEAQPTALDQLLGIGDGEKSRFQLIKWYGEGDDAYARPIRKPVDESVLISVGGVASEPESFQVDIETGVVTFVDGLAPGVGQELRAGYEFDVPARFDTERIEINLTAFNAGQIPSIPIVELILP